MESGENAAETQDVPQAMAFTVTFDTARAVNNKFIKRHVRNLSLPIAKVYDSRPPGETHLNGKGLKNIGNHSEGYFSSDPEEDPGVPKKLTNQLKNINGADWSGEVEGEDEGERTHEGSGDSDVVSEAGTYTVDKEPQEVITARLSIDANFGIHAPSTSNSNMQTSRDSPHWINEWATQVVSHNQQSIEAPYVPPPATAPVLTRPRPVSATRPLGGSKIPSPVVSRARLGSRGSSSTSVRTRPDESTNHHNTPTHKPEGIHHETERYLKTTERVMEVLAARLSLDSESDPECGVSPQQAPGRSTDSSASESTSRGLPARYPPPFSGRVRVEDSGGGKKPSVLAGSRQEEVFKRPSNPSPTTASRPSRTPTTPVLSRTDTGRFSMRINKHPPSPQLGTAKALPSVSVPKKKAATGGRSNSTLSSKEVEFQNWKRRKSYDPMKAAAEGKKKEVRKSQCSAASPVVNPHSHSHTSCNTVSVLRSASFHGTRQLGSALPLHASSSDDEDLINMSNEEEDWPVLQAPRKQIETTEAISRSDFSCPKSTRPVTTSRESTPLGSRVSLYSNASNSSNKAPRHKLEGVDNLVISAVANLSGKLKLSGSSLLRKLRCLYDEQSDKSKQLTAEIDQLEASDQSTPISPQKSPSKELAYSLRNLKRIDSMIKVLDEVLFDNTEYE